MKHLTRFVLTMLVALTSNLSVIAHDFEAVNEGNTIYYLITSNEDKTCAVTYRTSSSLGNTYSGSVVIPSCVEYKSTTYNVTSIGGSAFCKCSGLTSITIPNSVTSICSGAFENCKNLTSVVLPNSVTEIGSYAFQGCSGLTSITIPDHVTVISSFVFRNCSDLTSITIPKGVIEIGSSAFSGCSGLMSINIPNSVTVIGSSAFSGCSGLMSINIPNSVTEIGSSAFSGCSGLTSIIIPNNVTEIGDATFESCVSLKSITISNSVTKIGSSAFSGCSNLTSITIPDNVTEIGDATFENCSGLTSITIPNSVTKIGGKLFYNCSGLTSIAIPNNVTEIGSSAFSGCSRLKSIVIPNSVTSISSGAFERCRDLTSITIPNSVTKIGSSAFSGCSGLNDIHISDINSWMKIKFNENNTFKYKYDLYLNGLKLTNLVVPKEINIVPAFSFYNCLSLETITLHEDINAIVQNAFNGCANVKEIYCQSVTPPACGAKALEGISRSECTLYVPKGSTEYYTTVPWNEFTNIVGENVVEPETPETCAAPTISIVNGQLHIESPSYGAECHYTIECSDVGSGTVAKNTLIPLSGQYIITAYATAEGMYNSETVSAILVWVNPTIQGASNVISMEAKKAVVIKTVGGNIHICGTEQGESILLYSLNGILLNSTRSNDVETTIPCNLQKGETYIIKYGDKSIKYRF